MNKSHVFLVICLYYKGYVGFSCRLFRKNWLSLFIIEFNKSPELKKNLNQNQENKNENSSIASLFYIITDHLVVLYICRNTIKYTGDAPILTFQIFFFRSSVISMNKKCDDKNKKIKIPLKKIKNILALRLSRKGAQERELNI